MPSTAACRARPGWPRRRSPRRAARSKRSPSASAIRTAGAIIRSLEIRPDDAFGNAWRAQEFEYRHQLAKLGQPVERGEWWLGAHTVNAVFLPLQNAMNFPAGILEPPFYDRTADPAYNYGAIGSVIGHEISHSFDNLGAEFDAEGRLRNWWTAAGPAPISARPSQALVRQYNAYQRLPRSHTSTAS